MADASEVARLREEVSSLKAQVCHPRHVGLMSFPRTCLMLSGHFIVQLVHQQHGDAHMALEWETVRHVETYLCALGALSFAHWNTKPRITVLGAPRSIVLLATL